MAERPTSAIQSFELFNSVRSASSAHLLVGHLVVLFWRAHAMRSAGVCLRTGRRSRGFAMSRHLFVGHLIVVLRRSHSVGSFACSRVGVCRLAPDQDRCEDSCHGGFRESGFDRFHGVGCLGLRRRISDDSVKLRFLHASCFTAFANDSTQIGRLCD